MRELISVIIPARNEGPRIGATVRAALAQAQALDADAEVIVVDDGSEDDTGAEAERAGATTLRLEGAGNPGAARNRGARTAKGDLLIFLDADCVPARGWLEALLKAQAAGESCVGGSLGMPPALPTTARWDYYFSTYHLHPDRPAGPVPSLTPANLSVRRKAFESTRGFTEIMPVANGHEELEWQSALIRAGGRCYFEPRAVAYHHNRPGMRNLLARSHRWAYSAMQAKSESGAARLKWLYRHPLALIAAAPFTTPLETAYIVYCWLRVWRFEPLLAFPVLFLARVVYAAGMSQGGWRWLASQRRAASVPA